MDASPVEKADVAVAKAAGPMQHHPITRALGTLSELADQPQMVTLNSVVLAAGLLSGRPRLARAGARMLMAHLLATAMKHAIKSRVDRTRPSVVVDQGRYEMRAGNSEESEENSFPSGHTAGAAAVAQAYAREFPEHAGAAAATAATVALIQIPRCAHYPTDLAAGAAIGSVAEAIVGATVGGVLAFVERAAVRQAARLDRSGNAEIADTDS